MSTKEEQWEAWIASRPPCVQKLARQFPITTTVEIDGTLHYLIGYTENNMLILTPINPVDDYEQAHAEKIYVCAKHLTQKGHKS
jgi:hypothetical protein